MLLAMGNSLRSGKKVGVYHIPCLGCGGKWPMVPNNESKKTILNANGTDWSGMHDH